MKKILFLLLFPSLALAQYQGNANQKITLGEQTTADGLVYRGVASIDTVTATSKITRANKQDTSAFLLLDTVTNLLWHYKIGSNRWIQAGGGDTSLIAYVNTYGTQTVNGAKTFTSAVTATRFNPTENTATGTGMFAPTSTSLGFSTNGINRMTLDASGNLGLGVTPYSTSSLIKTFDFNTTGGFGSYSNSTNTQFTYLSSNAYINVGVNWAYKYSGVPASTFMQNTGEYQWFTAPSGTADNIISFTRVMTLKNNGNLGIGTESPTARLHVKGSTPDGTASAFKIDNSGNTNLLNILNNGVATFRNISNSGAPATSGTTVNATLSIDNAFSVMTNIGNLSASPYSVWLQVQDKGNLAITYPLSLQPNGGNVGIGTASPSEKLHVDGNGLFTGNLSLGTPLSVANGGTGATTYGDSTLLQGRGTSAISSSTDLLFNYTTKTLKVNGLYIGLGNSNVSSNIKIGNLATLSKNAAGGNTNTAIGSFALENNTTGDENLAIGSYAMNFNTTGGYSVAIGANTLYKSTTANFNCAIGRSSLQELKTGTKNVAIGGNDTGYATDSTNNSTIIGTEAGGITTLLTGGTNNTLLGYRAISSTGTVSNEITLGNSSITTLRCAAALSGLSDMRDKTDILPLNYGMNFIEKLKPVSFVWDMRDGGKIGIPEIGFIAQDLQQAQIDSGINVPNLVSGTEEKLEASYSVLLPIIVKTLQEANEKIKSLEQRILTLENK